MRADPKQSIITNGITTTMKVKKNWRFATSSGKTALTTYQTTKTVAPVTNSATKPMRIRSENGMNRVPRTVKMVPGPPEATERKTNKVSWARHERLPQRK